ncbi:type VI-B CRISPR-associated RNA-guided ribonuclease Cas13b [Prevotella intermedia]|uniref:type VI-B CRISPR-associated RNA-guided ribonuclease Cas13b n=1 Tax=Prevotella intermedia TaxID=28131 RepID=UPI00211B2001|nr:type VI-B CRISPR-associated RNA-guided ribonuclease Cas13b [Prevotella intermedia]
MLKTENTKNDNKVEGKKETKKQEKHKIEAIIESKIKDMYALYDAFANGEINSKEELKEYLKGKDIEIVHLPKQMIAILKNKHKDMAEKAEAKQEKMKLATENRLKTLDKQLKGKIQNGKRYNSAPKSGEIASWLVNDMMRFQPVQRDENGEPLNNSKANSTEYQLLQRTLAFFGSEHEHLAPYFKQTKLIESSNPHPFLNDTEWEKCSNILSFYRSYLEAKKNFLESLKPEDWEKNQYFLMLKEPKTNRKTLVQGWKNGFNLPRGIFTEPIRKWFMEHWKNIKVDDSKRVGLVAKVIPLFFSEKYKDSVQPFYNYPFNVGDVNKPKEEDFLHREERIELWDKKKDKFKGYKAKKKFKEMTDKEKEEHRSYLEFQSWNKFERELRLVRNQDIVTWLLCTELIDKLKIDELNIKELKKLRLKDINTDTAKEEKNNILNRVMSMELPVTVYEVNKGGYIIKNKPLHTIYIKEAKTKLLKQGNFKALVKDRRLNGLFSFVKTPSEAESESNPISKSRVESELGKYQNARLNIIEDMLALEKTLIDKYNSLDTDNFHNMLTGWLKLKGKANKARFQNEVDLLVAVRNAFSHNQYPMYDENLFGNIERFSLSSSNIIESKGLDIAVKLKEEVSKAAKKIQNEEDNKKEKET